MVVVLLLLRWLRGRPWRLNSGGSMVGFGACELQSELPVMKSGSSSVRGRRNCLRNEVCIST